MSSNESLPPRRARTQSSSLGRNNIVRRHCTMVDAISHCLQREAARRNHTAWQLANALRVRDVDRDHLHISSEHAEKIALDFADRCARYFGVDAVCIRVVADVFRGVRFDLANDDLAEHPFERAVWMLCALPELKGLPLVDPNDWSWERFELIARLYEARQGDPTLGIAELLASIEHLLDVVEVERSMLRLGRFQTANPRA